jgi:hypothetical protein
MSRKQAFGDRSQKRRTVLRGNLALHVADRPRPVEKSRLKHVSAQLTTKVGVEVEGGMQQGAISPAAGARAAAPCCGMWGPASCPA